MQDKYYKVLAKCGHVGRNKYIIKWFYVKAVNAKDAAMQVKYIPRVKHHHKDAIRQVIEIDFNKYIEGLKLMLCDDYFRIHNSSEQKIYNFYNLENMFYEETKEEKDEKDNSKLILKYKIIARETRKLLQGGIYD